MAHSIKSLANIEALKQWRPFLLGIPFQVKTDHAGLLSILRAKKTPMTPRMARWQLKLSEFNITEISHIPGPKNVLADALSREPLDQEQESQDVAPELPIFSLTSNADSFQQIQLGDPAAATLIAELTMDSASAANQRKFTLRNGCLYKAYHGLEADKLYVPKNFVPILLREFHDSPLTGAHLGLRKTLAKLRMRYWWPTFKKDVANYIQSCPKCQLSKAPRIKPAGLMSFIDIPSSPFETVQIDFWGPVTMSQGKKYILTLTDSFSKWLIAVATADCTALTAAKFLYHEVLTKFGAPRTLMSDRGTHFTHSIIKELNAMAGTRHILSTADHPRTQGIVERSHSTLNECLRSYTAASQKDWANFLPAVTFALNTSPSASHGYSPYFLLYGREANLPSDTMAPTIRLSSRRLPRRSAPRAHHDACYHATAAAAVRATVWYSSSGLPLRSWRSCPPPEQSPKAGHLSKASSSLSRPSVYHRHS